MEAEALRALIESQLTESKVEVRGEGDHFEVVVVTPDFEGLGLVQRQRKVYATLGDLMQSEIHALSMRTLTPEEAAKQSKFRVTAQ